MEKYRFLPGFRNGEAHFGNFTQTNRAFSQLLSSSADDSVVRTGRNTIDRKIKDRKNNRNNKIEDGMKMKCVEELK